MTDSEQNEKKDWQRDEADESVSDIHLSIVHNDSEQNKLINSSGVWKFHSHLYRSLNFLKHVVHEAP